MFKWFWKSKDGDLTEDELKKQGFSPETTNTVESKEEPIMDFTKDYEGFITSSSEEISSHIANYKC